MPTFKQIEAVYWVHTLGGFSAAAEKLHATQSTISKRIIDLEDFLGIDIFDRQNRTRLTVEGRSLLDAFTRMLDIRQDVVARTQDPGSYSGFFRLGVTEMVALTWLPDLIALIKKDYPKMILESRVDMARTLCQQIASNELDFVISPLMEDMDSHIATSFLSTLELTWAIRSELLVSPRKIYSMAEIASFPLLSHSDGSMLHKTLKDSFLTGGAAPKDKLFCGSMIAMAELARAGLGVAYLPKAYFSAYFCRRGLRAIKTDFPMPKMDYYAIYRADKISDRIAQLASASCNFSHKRQVLAP
ncbi:LysR family transcriptional regulator [Allopusillimonas ginsengisoli]|uniref:LysR family transcriptional regulator n=1 Tax=Allopusillimonas ginsengisoli TaxID=453575 RepID=UPI00101F17D9|nr:LysR family transcriptional regulator [Allopusillimonas ginsengisoli]TEA79043.1 LysR family transcriptional regulator [Allopusillimonas ginsengisoli]